jgi:hypothetical protein
MREALESRRAASGDSTSFKEIFEHETELIGK